ncbi:hypothetical protein Trydic_g9100 [Trypoxylus dichotomus]
MFITISGSPSPLAGCKKYTSRASRGYKSDINDRRADKAAPSVRETARGWNEGRSKYPHRQEQQQQQQRRQKKRRRSSRPLDGTKMKKNGVK